MNLRIAKKNLSILRLRILPKKAFPSITYTYVYFVFFILYLQVLNFFKFGQFLLVRLLPLLSIILPQIYFFWPNNV